MADEVFIDAGAWIAVTDSHDKYHGVATELYKNLIQENARLVTTNLVIAEAYIIIRRTGGYQVAMRFLQALKASPRLLRVFSSESLESEAEEILLQYSDQDFSYADGVSFAVMKDRKIKKAFAFDRHFSTAGFQVIP